MSRRAFRLLQPLSWASVLAYEERHFLCLKGLLSGAAALPMSMPSRFPPAILAAPFLLRLSQSPTASPSPMQLKDYALAQVRPLPRAPACDACSNALQALLLAAAHPGGARACTPLSGRCLEGTLRLLAALAEPDQ